MKDWPTQVSIELSVSYVSNLLDNPLEAKACYQHVQTTDVFHHNWLSLLFLRHPPLTQTQVLVEAQAPLHRLEKLLKPSR